MSFIRRCLHRITAAWAARREPSPEEEWRRREREAAKRHLDQLKAQLLEIEASDFAGRPLPPREKRP